MLLLFFFFNNYPVWEKKALGTFSRSFYSTKTLLPTVSSAPVRSGVVFSPAVSLHTCATNSRGRTTHHKRYTRLIMSSLTTSILLSLPPAFAHVSLFLRPLSRGFSVNLADCGDGPVLLSVSDPSFTVYSDGEVVAVRSVSVSARGQTFSVEARDGDGQRREMEVHLIRAPTQQRKVRRQRECVCPPLWVFVCQTKKTFPDLVPCLSRQEDKAS